jgi:hypothetical protein
VHCSRLHIDYNKNSSLTGIKDDRTSYLLLHFFNLLSLRTDTIGGYRHDHRRKDTPPDRPAALASFYIRWLPDSSSRCLIDVLNGYKGQGSVLIFFGAFRENT